MPNKESFTFSDKLRKSKSVPLSKRLPSVVGGQNKQKRTLVQRAQRDLPFILVAALALLLLPFLSRTGSDDIASTDNIAWNTLGGDETSFVEGGGADIMPAGTMKDPLDWIIGARSDVEKTAATAGTDASKSAYGSGTGSSSSYGKKYNTGDGSAYGSRSKSSSYSGTTSTKKPAKSDYNSSRKGYEETYTTKTTKKPATDKYKKTKAAVRKSFERKGTDINRALRLSQLPSNKGGSGVSHALPLGQGPGRTPNTSFREGIRPVALQPMEAHGGVGRSMTGENLYAEAARSIREMNAGGPAKQNLLAAQMRDVDGQLTPEGPGGFGTGASVRPGAGGQGPGGNNGYNIGKPWWWDMMQARSQKMWDLLYYKPREIFWNNIYNYMSQLMNCLATGNKDGDVSSMFGKKAGTDDYICKKKDIPSLQDYMEFGQHSTQTKEGGKETGYSFSPKEWFDLCGEGNYVKDPSSRKSFWQVRFECVGLDYKRMKSWFKAKEYGADCFKVNSDPMELTYTVTKNGKDRERLENKAVIALVAKVKKADAKAERHFGHILEAQRNYYYSLKDQEIIIYAQMGNKFSMPQEVVKTLYNPDICSLTKIIAFVPRANSGAVERNLERANFTKEFDSDAYHKEHPQVVDEDGNPAPLYTAGEDFARFVHGTRVNNWARFRGQIEAARNVCNGQVTNADVHPLTFDSVYDIADFVSSDGLLNSGVKKNSLKICSLWGEKPVFEKFINGKPCKDECVNGDCMQQVNILDNVTFSANISNSKDKHVYAVLVDHIDQQTKAKVTTIADFGSSGAAGARKCGADAGFPDEPDKCTYAFNINVASLGLNPNDLMTGQVVTLPSNYSQTPVVTSGDARITTSQAISSNYQQNTAINEAEERWNEQCIQDCENETNRTSTTTTRDAEGKETTTIRVLSKPECLAQCKAQYVQGNQTGLNGSASESGVQTARGSGIIFWIVAEGEVTFKVHEGDEVAGNIWSVNIEDIIESTKAVMFEVCRYRWCNGIGRCNARPDEQTPPPANPDYCKEGDQVFIATKTTINGQEVYVKIDGGTPQNVAITDEMKECVILCQDSAGNVHICDPNGDPDPTKPTCPLDELPNKEALNIPPCPTCCTHKNGKMYPSVEVKQDDGSSKFYITDAREGQCTKSNGVCSPAAWSKEGGELGELFVYDISNYNEDCLKYIPMDTVEPFNTAKGTGVAEDCDEEVELIPLDNKPFNLIHGQSKYMDPNRDPAGLHDPQFFELFPQLKLPTADNIPVIDLTDCNVCEPVEYNNAWVTPINNIDRTISGKIKNCLDQIETLKNSLPADKQALLDNKFDKLYFYGYASKRGSHDPGMITGASDDIVGCTTSKHGDGSLTGRHHTMWDRDYFELGDCNKALSEDRNLYIMAQAVRDSGRPGNITIDKTSSEKYLAHASDGTPYKGFSNTQAARGVNIIRSTKRLDRSYIADLVSDTPRGFTFISRPCGSDGAIYDYNVDVNTGLKDRYVVVTLIGNDDAEERCQDGNRMTCDIAEAELANLIGELNSALGTDRITFSPRGS